MPVLQFWSTKNGEYWRSVFDTNNQNLMNTLYNLLYKDYKILLHNNDKERIQLMDIMNVSHLEQESNKTVMAQRTFSQLESGERQNGARWWFSY